MCVCVVGGGGGGEGVSQRIKAKMKHKCVRDYGKITHGVRGLVIIVISV